jgi:GTP-binding protein
MINTVTNRKKLAKTSKTPGKTQSINVFNVDNLFYLVDLPGYGFAKVAFAVKSKWDKLLDNYFKKFSNHIKLGFTLIDIRRNISKEDLAMINMYNNADSCLNYIVLTKSDKFKNNEKKVKLDKFKKEYPFLNDLFILFSAKSKEGRLEVLKIIKKILK